MKSNAHPNTTELQRWLSTTGDDAVGRHVDHCEDCQAALEEISGLDDELVADLATVLSAPPGYEGRTTTRVEQRLRDEEAAGALFDLFGLGWSMFRLMTDVREEGGRDHA